MHSLANVDCKIIHGRVSVEGNTYYIVKVNLKDKTILSLNNNEFDTTIGIFIPYESVQN